MMENEKDDPVQEMPWLYSIGVTVISTRFKLMLLLIA